MAGASKPMLKDTVRALNRLTAEQFARVCSEIGYLEVTLPGNTQTAKASALVGKLRGEAELAALVRAINRVNPGAWRAVPVRGLLSSAVYGVLAFAVVFGIGGLAVALILSSVEPGAGPIPTATETPAPTRTPIPTFTYTPSPTSLPTEIATPTPTATSTRQAAPAATVQTPTATSTAPPVSIVYRKVEPLNPPRGSRHYPGATVEFRWVLRDASLQADERYWMRLYQNGVVVDSYLTPDSWRYYPVPGGAKGESAWTVTVVKLDSAGNVIGPLSPESDPVIVIWQE
jgi:hypothetical protein